MDFAELNKTCREFHKRLLAQVRVLVVDDEETITQFLKAALTDQGYRVDTAINAEEAWALIQNIHYDLLITDKNLPDTSGVELLGRIKAADIALPSMLITGYATVSTVSEALHHGASDYLTKPFDITHLNNRIQVVLDQRLSSLLYALIVRELGTAIEQQQVDDNTRALISASLNAFEDDLADRTKVLIVGDSIPGSSEIEQRLAELGISYDRVEPEQALLGLEEMGPLVALPHLETEGILPLIKELKGTDPHLEVLGLATDPVPLGTALEAVKAGATDFVLLADEGMSVLESRIRQAVDRARRRRVNLHLVATLYRVATDLGHTDWDELLAVLPAADQAYVRQAAATTVESNGRGDELNLSRFLEGPDERRRYPRFSTDHPVWVVYADGNKLASSFSQQVTAKDLSQGGMLLEGDPPPLGSIVMVHVPGESGEVLSTIGRVVRHKDHLDPPQFGIEFLRSERQIADIVMKLLVRIGK